MFSTTCWHLKSICVRAAAPLLMMSETENIWRMPTRTSAMMVMARSTSTKLLPRRARAPVRRSLAVRRLAILGHPRARRVLDLLGDTNAPDRIDAEHVAGRRHERPAYEGRVREDQRGGRGDLAAGGGVHRALLVITSEGARVGTGSGVVRPERG